MKLSDFLTALDKYFKDIFGMVIPGGILLIGLFFLRINEAFAVSIDPEKSNQLILGIIAAYLLGHIIANLRYTLLPQKNHHAIDMTGNPSYQAFNQWAMKKSAEKLSISHSEFHIAYSFKDLRSMAMTVSTKGESLSRRFKFIELLCAGTAVSLIIFAILGGLTSIFKLVKRQPMELEVLISIAVAVLFVWPLTARARTYKNQSDRVPFECAVAEILNKDK